MTLQSRDDYQTIINIYFSKYNVSEATKTKQYRFPAIAGNIYRHRFLVVINITYLLDKLSMPVSNVTKQNLCENTDFIRTCSDKKINCAYFSCNNLSVRFSAF